MSPSQGGSVNVVCVLHRPLACERVFPELLPSPLRRSQDVYPEAARGARAAPLDLSRARPLLSVAARVRHPASATPRILRHAARSALTPLLPRRAADDASHQAPLRRLRLPARGARTALCWRIPGVEAHRRDARAVLGGAGGLGLASLRALLLPCDALVAMGAPAAPVGDGSHPWRHRELVRPQVWISQL